MNTPIAMIEYRSNGFWAPLSESTLRTAFRFGPIPYASRADADAALGELVAVGWRRTDLRVSDYRVDEFAPAGLPSQGGED